MIFAAKLLKSVVLGAILAFNALNTHASTFLRGTVVYVDDGDTVVLLVDDRVQMKVRLSSIDAPESSHTNKEKGRIGQPHSSNATEFLAGLVKGKSVVAKCYEHDKYDRNVCEIFIGGASVNRTLVKEGLAWANVAANGRYLRDDGIQGLQQEAKAAGLGLWAGSAPVAPWEWRKRCWEQGKCN